MNGFGKEIKSLNETQFEKKRQQYPHEMMLRLRIGTNVDVSLFLVKIDRNLVIEKRMSEM